MPFEKGHKRYGGRTKGTPNKSTQDLVDLVKKVGIDPFEVLLRLAKEDWEGLGYPARTRTTFTPQGIEVEEYIISPELRGKCSAEACKYIHAQRKAIENVVPQELMDIWKMIEGLSDEDVEKKIAEIKDKGA